MKANTAYACAWTVTAIAIITGLYITKNANCLWAFFIPLFISTSSKSDSEKSQ